MQERLDRTKYSDAQLLEIISEQVLEGNDINFSLLIAVSCSPIFKCSMVNDVRLKNAIEMTIKRCDEECIKGTNSHALMLRGFLFHQGIGTSVNYAEAIHCYETAILLGNSFAMNNRGYMYQYGHGGSVDYAAAIVLYEQAIALGNADAMYNCALMYEDGSGGAVDYVKAIALYEQAIALGNVYAMYNRALMHEEGRGGPVDDSKAAVLYEQAIALGDADSMVNRALMHEEGKGGPVNYIQAIALYEQAIRAGSNSAQDTLQGIDITSPMALEMLDLLWDELVKGTSFSMHTLSALSTHCKTSVLEQINKLYLGTNLRFLKQVKTNPQHPLAVIINDGKTDEESAEFKELMKQASLICGARQGFFSEKYSPVLPPEIKNHIFSFLQPGMEYDRKAEQRQNAPNDTALKRACMKQDLVAIKRLMEGNLDNKPSTDAVYGALITVVEKGHLSVVKQLCSYLHLDDERIETLCYCAQTHNQESIINWFIEPYDLHQELIGMTSNPIRLK